MTTMSKPVLFRIARGMSLLGTLVSVLLAAFLATAGYSASEIRPHPGPLNQVRLSGTNVVELTATVNLSNPGFYAITGFGIQAQVHLNDSNGTLLAQGSTPAEAISAGTVASVPFSIHVPLGTSGPVWLLTKDARLPTILWVNATYAGSFAIRLTVPDNLSWGAPFYGLTITSGSPTPQLNGTVSVPVTLRFSNHAQFGLAGTLDYTLRSASGASCGGGSMNVDAPPGSEYTGGSTAFATAGCDPRGGTIDSEFVGPSWDLALPAEPIP